MSTDQLIAKVLSAGGGEPTENAFDALQTLLDDSTVEASATPKGIADASAIVGLSSSTLRYYEREGLVTPSRDASGHRLYGPQHLRRLVFCTRMRLSGMAMSDLKRYIRLVDDGESTIAQRRQIMLDHRDKIRRRQRELALALAATDYKIATYGGSPTP